MNIMEIERKWMVQGWPQGLPLLETYRMDQGYISVRPTVRIRREALQDEVTIGGVATYMERADKANVNLFI